MNFELRREHHAIGEFTASIDFFQPVSATTFANVTDRLKALAERFELPARVPVQIFQLMIGPSPQHVAPPSSAGGLGFQRFSPEGEVAEAIACEANSIKYTLRDYTIWEKVAPKLVDIASQLTSEYLNEVPAIQAIRVQYQNEFKSNAGVASAAELFRPDSKWVAPLAHADGQAWHSHVGLYVPSTENERYLINVNCDIGVNETHGTKSMLAKVLVLAGCYFNIPGRKPLLVTKDDVSEVLRAKLDEAHEVEKEVLREVISDPYLEAMGAQNVH